jgi:hypothetical protein
MQQPATIYNGLQLVDCLVTVAAQLFAKHQVNNERQRN